MMDWDGSCIGLEVDMSREGQDGWLYEWKKSGERKEGYTYYDSLFIMLRASEPPLRRKAIVKMPSKSDAARLTARVM